MDSYLDALAGRVAEAEYVVICGHGMSVPDESGCEKPHPGLGFNRLVDEVDGRWESLSKLQLPAEELPGLLGLQGRTVLNLGCNGGDARLAQAFLDAGCPAYAGAVDYVDQDAGPLFAIAFFYHLLRHEREPRAPYTPAEAARLAAACDTASREGTHLFRYYEAAEVSPE